jgi:hypothetical protein
MLADVLTALAGAGANLRVVMGYTFPGQSDHAAIEVYPVSGKKVSGAASAAGLEPSPIPCLLVEGDDRAGLGADMARAVAGQNVNVSFVMAETVGRRFSAVFGFDSDAAAATAGKAIKGAGAKRKR